MVIPWGGVWRDREEFPSIWQVPRPANLLILPHSIGLMSLTTKGPEQEWELPRSGPQCPVPAMRHVIVEHRPW